MKMESFEDLRSELLDDKDVKIAAAENRLRRQLASVFEAARLERKLSVRELASAMGTSASQVQRLLHHAHGGSLTLSTLCRAADALDLDVAFDMRAKRAHAAPLVPFTPSGWTKTHVEQVEEHLALPAPTAGERPSKTWNSSPLGSDVASPARRAVGE